MLLFFNVRAIAEKHGEEGLCISADGIGFEKEMIIYVYKSPIEKINITLWGPMPEFKKFRSFIHSFTIGRGGGE